MAQEISDTHRANLMGSLLMVTAMALFAVEDSLLKATSQNMPVGQIMIVFGLGGAAVFAGIAVVRNEPLFVVGVLSKPMRIRVVFEVIGRLFYTLAITLTPLSAATVILQATPLVVIAGAALVFGEKVGWRRWGAIIIGFIGVVIIVQPGTDHFSLLSVFAVLGMIGFAGRDLASRAAPATLTTSILGFYGFLSIVVAGGLFTIWEGIPLVVPATEACFYLAGATLAGVFAYSCLMRAMRTGEVSAVTPFRYTRLLFGITLGVVFFGESMSLETLLGSVLIVFSGLFILWRGNSA